MKQIKIFFSDATHIVLEDNDDRAIEEYTSELSKVLESNNIAILHTSADSTIIRPNKISAIIITLIETQKESTSKKHSSESEKKIQKESDSKQQDIITD